jgi:hypothetical protein
MHDLGIKVQRLIKFFDLEIKPLEEGIRCSSLEEISEIEPLEEGIRCSSLEEIEDTVPVRRGVEGPSPEERAFTIGAAASANSL